MKRVDLILVERGLFPSREKAQASIIAGEVWAGEVRIDKPGTSVKDDIVLEVRRRSPDFASRGGHKLEKALQVFAVDPRGKVAIDIGASTGGFTDCLLRAGASHVIAVDVGHGQLDHKLRIDPRVTVKERTNARYLAKTDLPPDRVGSLSLAVMDVSFISSLTLLQHLVVELPSIEDWLILFKPQFEVGREHVRKGGVVTDETAIAAALDRYRERIDSLGLTMASPVETSPISGKKSGNVEYLMHLRKKS